MNKNTTRLSFSYPESLQRPLKRIAKEESRSLPNLIKKILNEFLDKKGEK